MKDYVRKNSNDKSIYQATANTDGTICVFPQGGGFCASISAANFANGFIEVTDAFPLRRATVTAHFLPDDMVLECVGSGRRWNGSGMPMFERHTVDQLISVRITDYGHPIIRWDGDTLLVLNDDFNPDLPENTKNEKFERYEPEMVSIDGQTLTVWTVGNCWTWDGLKFRLPMTRD